MMFLLAMVLYPDVMKRAQTVIDTAVGPDRPPTFKDLSSLPYMDALVREVHRWRPSTPLGIAVTSPSSQSDGQSLPGFPRRCMEVRIMAHVYDCFVTFLLRTTGTWGT